MAAEPGAHVHHGAQRCLLGHFDTADTGGFADRSEVDAAAARLSIEVRELSCEDLSALIESSTFEIPTTEHRRLHQEASNFVRWGKRGGRRTLALYGRLCFSLLVRFRWGRIGVEALIEDRSGGDILHRGPWAAHTPSLHQRQALEPLGKVVDVPVGDGTGRTVHRPLRPTSAPVAPPGRL
jgi:hypothetical protein